MEKKITIEILTTISDIEKIKDEWIELESKAVYASIYNSYLVQFESYKQYVVKHSELVFLLCRNEDNELVAIFTFYKHKKQWSRFINVEHLAQIGENEEIDKPYPLIHKDYEPIVWPKIIECLKANPHLWEVIEFREMPEDLTGRHYVEKEFNQQKSKYFVRTSEGVITPIVKLDKTWEDFIASHRRLRKFIRKMEKDFEDFEYEIVHDSDNAQENLQKYFDLEKRSWKYESVDGSKPVAISAYEASKRLYKEILPKLAETKSLVFGFLHCDGKIIASEFSYIYQNKVYFAQGCYDADEKYKKYSPGKISTALFLKYFFNKGYEHGDYLGGYALTYVEPWTDKKLGCHDQLVYRLSLKMLFALFYRKLRATYKKFTEKKTET